MFVRPDKRVIVPIHNTANDELHEYIIPEKRPKKFLYYMFTVTVFIISLLCIFTV